MFTVEYKGQQYKVRFWHNNLNTGGWWDSKSKEWIERRGRTDCEIRTMIGQVGYGITQCSLSDHYNGITGEKIALARALKQMTEHEQDLVGYPIDRDFRLAFWKAWFLTLKGKRSEKARTSFMAQLGI